MSQPKTTTDTTSASLMAEKQISQPSKFGRWELGSCFLQGHATFKPVGENAESYRDKLHATSSQGELWRCLRCGVYQLGEPRFEGSVTHAPRILRGKALRSAMILRFLSLERGFRAIFLLAFSYGLYRLQTDQASLQAIFARDLPVLQTAGNQLNISAEMTTLTNFVGHTLSISPKALFLTTLLFTAYGILQLVEGIGLWLMKRWGEYFAAIATSIFIPLEAYELSKHITVFKFVVLLLNIAAILYLVLSKRLFGMRGGREAYERDLDSESLLEVTRATK